MIAEAPEGVRGGSYRSVPRAVRRRSRPAPPVMRNVGMDGVSELAQLTTAGLLQRPSIGPFGSCIAMAPFAKVRAQPGALALGGGSIMSTRTIRLLRWGAVAVLFSVSATPSFAAYHAPGPSAHVARGAVRGAPSLSANGGVAQRVSAPAQVVTALYDQTTDDSGYATVSQNFEATNDAFDSQMADDFTVPAAHRWRITSITALGAYFGGSGPASSFNVTIYKAQPIKGIPTTVVKTFTGVVPSVDSAGTVTLPLTPFNLTQGVFWVSVQANLDSNVGGDWGWENQATTRTGWTPDFRNPGNGFGTGCVTWSRELACTSTGGFGLMFTIYGTDTLLP